MIFYFSKGDVLHNQPKLIDDFGGSQGLRDEGMLESSIYTPLQTFASQDLYPTAVEKITRLSFGLAMDHPFIDGNKRIASAVLYLGLKANSFDFQASDREVIQEFLSLASGEITYMAFLSWVKSHIE